MKIIYFIGLLFILSFSSCGIFKKEIVVNGENNNINSKSVNEKAEFLFYFSEANKEEMLGNHEQAIALFHKSLEINKNCSACLYEISRIYYKLNDYKTALENAEHAIHLNASNEWYILLCADLNVKLQNYDRAIGLYEKLSALQPENTNFLYNLANLYVSTNKLPKAIEVCNKIEAMQGVNPQSSLMKNQLYYKLGNKNQAKNELEILMNTFPAEKKYAGMLAEYYAAEGDNFKADSIYRSLLLKETDHGYIYLSYYNFLRNQGKFDDAYIQLKNAFYSQEIELDSKFEVIFSPIYVKPDPILSNEKIFSLLNILIEVHPDDPQVHNVYADYLIKNNQLEEAAVQLQQVISIVKNDFTIWEKLLQVQIETGNYSQLLTESEQAIELFPNTPVLFLYKGMAAFYTNQYTIAEESFIYGKSIVIDNLTLESQFNLFLGEVYNKLKKYSDSDRAFDLYLLHDNKNTFVLNNYSYYLALRGEKLDKAENMIRKCLTFEPNNPSFLDTYAWVLYKAQRYNESKVIIEKALSHSKSKNAVLIEHYGDILYKLGEKIKAKEQWQIAIGAGNGSQYLKQKVDTGELVE